MEHRALQWEYTPSNYRMPPVAVKKRIQRPSYVPVDENGERMTRRQYLNREESKTMSDGTSPLTSPLLQRPTVKFNSFETDSNRQRSFLFTHLSKIASPSSPQVSRPCTSLTSSTAKCLQPACITADLPQKNEFEGSEESIDFDTMSVEFSCLSPSASFADNSSTKFIIRASYSHHPTDSDENSEMTKKDDRTFKPLEGCTVYARTCQKMDIPVSQSLYRSLQLTDINLKYQIFSQHQFRALAVALTKSWSVTSLNVSSTGLTDVSFRYLADVLKNNYTILELSAADNKLTSLSAQLLQDVMEHNAKLHTIDMSGNAFKDTDAICFAQIIQTNRYVKKMVLNHGNFGDEAGCILGRALCVSPSLKILDLSWNQFRKESAWQLIAQSSLNETLKVLDLSWNGLGKEGCDGLAEFLKVNTTLTDLNIASNRITQQAFKTLTKGLIRNHTLQYLKLGHNPITHVGVLEFLAKLKFLQLSKVPMLETLHHIDFEGILVGAEVIKLTQNVRKCLPHLQFVFGSQSQEIEISPSIPKRKAMKLTSYEAKCLLLESLVKGGLDPEHILPRKEAIKWHPCDVKEALLAMSVPLSEGAIDDIVRNLSEDGVISPCDILNRNKQRKKKNCHLSTYSK